MKALVVGGGSIGVRHLKNLKSLGVGPLAIVEPERQKRLALEQEEGITSYEFLEDGLNWDPCFVVIATPSSLHIDQAIQAARSGCHLFIEKPLSVTDEKLSELQWEIERRNLISLVGCNMRFHPGPAKLKELLDRMELGKVFFARIHTGSYLPMWRTKQDYRKSYSANAAMGGGCIFDCIHEIDLARWYLGEVDNVFCRAEHLSSLEIDAEDVAVLLCKHSCGALSEVHLDYVQRTYNRGCQIVGDQGSLFWDFNEGLVRWFDARKNRWLDFRQPEGWQVNWMYMDEMRYFLKCLDLEVQSMLPVKEAIKVMRIVFAAKRSVAFGCIMDI